VLMNIETYELTGKTTDLLTTEIMFFIASARAVKMDLVRLNIKKCFTDEREAKRVGAIIKVLKSIKRRGIIQLFIFSNEMENHSTESEYLENKYPELSKISMAEEFFLLKL